MLIALDKGHNSPSGDTGARGIKFEDELADQVVKALKPRLEEMGHEVVLTCPGKSSNVNESLRSRCNTANKAGADLFVSIHFNAFDGSAHGTEVWVNTPNSKAFEQAQDVVENIAALGYRNRGVKAKGFLVLRETSMPALLVECCFCDNRQDIAKFNAEDMAIAIARGIGGGAVRPSPPLHKDIEKATLRVKVGTVLKPSTEQSANIPADKVVAITPADYAIALLADEEGHYLVTFDSGKPQGEWFIFAKHCEVIH
jgi:N-acetylmuramoyl-L-alanine amidase